MGDQFRDFTLAAIQAAPIYLDREASIEKACRLIEEAGAKGAALAVFGETWVPGYASFAQFTGNPLSRMALMEFILNGVEVPSPATDALCKAAKRSGIDVSIDIAERDATTHGSIYCTMLFIGREGVILGKHRKLKPTFHERAVWVEGDGSTLVLYDRPYGRLGGLNCWEHQMVLPGYALIAQGLQVHAAAFPGGGPLFRQHILARAFAMQSAAYVVMAAGIYRDQDIPERYSEIVMRTSGESAIIGPDGEILAGPLSDEEGILTAKANLGYVSVMKLVADHGGHYTRPDVFDFRVNNSPKRIATFEGREEVESVTRSLQRGISTGQIRNDTELKGALHDVAPKLA